MDNMLRGYDFVKSQKRGKEFGISKKTGGKKGMKKERKRVLLAWIYGNCDARRCSAAADGFF